VSSSSLSLRSKLVASVLTFCLAAPAIIHAGNGSGESVASRIDIDNFARVDSTYYRGAEPAADDYDDLAALGIKTVVDLRSDDGDPQARQRAEEAGMHYVAIPMTTHVPPSDMQIDQFLRIVNGAEHQPVYVHCVGGRHRTGVMTAIYRMTRDRWSADQAFKEMKQYKYGADFLHPEFKQFVYAYKPELAQREVLAENITN
jgi:protein tyrosine/serine phosphatase